MNINIRKENRKDKEVIYNLIKEAFKSAQHSDGSEQDLVNRLRNSINYIQELSLVATCDNTIVGHIMFTKISIDNGEYENESLALAPLSVLPKYQRKGIGSRLINEGLKIAKDLGYKSVVVLGSEKYYPKFGFEEAKNFEINPPFDAPSENFMIIELEPGSLKNVKGVVKYSKEFFEI
ncbi:N-acetyltransferase [Paraclostridium ghonii]|uniref:N-acetyltransferase YhbS n=1 Tax=Paraclostridium ghonii TaxID=29358 RepID=A0ABU0MY18_9FIRM|nr:N-acetyltransferase [Paeniclostridium ghonii]MCM0167878.1 N-acetyltransferase [Paeniclostridium ghonii]MDQ0555812.1 putative N-acetyltransferase YhbS [Paeniclostridium ghonii]